MPTEKNKLIKEIIPTRNIFRVAGFKKGFSCAFKGLAYLFLYHRNMRIIFLCGLAAALLGVYLKLKNLEMALLFITITLVFMAEILNTAIELMMNIISEEYKTRIKIIKDISAGIVLIACANSLIIGYALFLRKLWYYFLR